jgi:hypothetical protein
MALVDACAPFATDEPAAVMPNEDATASSSSSSGEAGATPHNDAGGGPTIDASQGGECFDFSNGATNGFTLKGENAQPQAGGIRLIVEGAPFNTMQRTFHRDAGFTSTRIGVDMTITGDLPSGGQFADTLVFFYGLPADYMQTPQTGFELVDRGSVGVNIWGAPGSAPYKEYTVDVSKLPYGRTADALWIESAWSQAGAHVLAVGAAPVATLTAQTADQTKNDLTIRFGGQGFSGAPAITIFVRSLCVLLR